MILKRQFTIEQNKAALSSSQVSLFLVVSSGADIKPAAMLADRTVAAGLQRFPAARVRAEIHEKVGQFLGVETAHRHCYEHHATVAPAGDGLQGLVL